MMRLTRAAPRAARVPAGPCGGLARQHLDRLRRSGRGIPGHRTVVASSLRTVGNAHCLTTAAHSPFQPAAKAHSAQRVRLANGTPRSTRYLKAARRLRLSTIMYRIAACYGNSSKQREP